MLTIEHIAKALKNSGGFIAHAAEALGVTPGAISTRIKRSPKLQQVMIEIKEKYLDLAESILIKKIKDKDTASVFFYLKCQGKHRGYVEKQIIDNNVTTNEAVKVELVLPKDADS